MNKSSTSCAATATLHDFTDMHVKLGFAEMNRELMRIAGKGAGYNHIISIVFS